MSFPGSVMKIAILFSFLIRPAAVCMSVHYQWRHFKPFMYPYMLNHVQNSPFFVQYSTDEQTDEQVYIQTDATHTPNKTTEEKVKESNNKSTTKKTKTKTHKNVTVTKKYNKKAKGSRKLKVNLPSTIHVEKQKDESRPDSNESAYETDNEDTNETKSEMKYDLQYNITVNDDENITNEKDCQTNKNEHSSDQRRSNDEKCHENEIDNVSKQHANDDENIAAYNDKSTATENKERSSPKRTINDENGNENENDEAQKQVNDDENVKKANGDDGEYKIEVKYRTRDSLNNTNQAKGLVSEEEGTDRSCKIVEVKYRTRDNINQAKEQPTQEEKGNRTTSDLQGSETTMTTTTKTAVTKYSTETSKTVKDSKGNKVVNNALENSKDETKSKKEKQNQNEKKHKTKKKNKIENDNKIQDDDLGESGNENSFGNEETKQKRPKTSAVGTQCGTNIDKIKLFQEDGDIFSPDEDCIKLHEAIHGKKTDKDTVNHRLRSMAQRLDMAHAYKVRYDKNVLDDIRSEFKGDYRDLCTALLQDQTTQDAELINYSVKGLGTNEMALTHILASRSPQELAKIRERYFELYGHPVDDDIRGDTSGSFQTLCLVQLSQSDDDGEQTDERTVEEDARRLWRPGEGPTQDHEDALIEILTSFNKQQFASVCHIYQKITDLPLKEAITQSTKGDFRDALLTMASYLEDSMNYYTETLDKSLKGFRSNDRVVINIVISRAETNLQQIYEAFKTKHGKTLHQAVTSNYSGDFADLLLQLIEQNQTGQ